MKYYVKSLEHCSQITFYIKLELVFYSIIEN
jgi:hypothetical protein